MNTEKAIVAINGSFLAQPLSGVQRYARELCRALTARHSRSFRTVLISPRAGGTDPELGALADRVEVDRVPVRPPLWAQVRLPRLVRRNRSALLWSPGGAGPLRVRDQICTIHDASVFCDEPWYGTAFRSYYRWLLPRLADRVASVVTLSGFSRAQIEQHLDLSADRISVIPCGVSERFVACELPARFREYVPYVLAFGGDNPRKNTITALRAWALLPESLRRSHHLLLFGARAGIHRRADLPQLPPQVRSLGFVSESELPGLYAGARALLYPSLYEGFGLPPLEALACGVPAVVSDAGALPEIFGRAALYCQPQDAEELARRTLQLLSDPRLRRSLLEEGAKVLRTYRWENSAAQLELVLARHLEETSRRDTGS